MSEPTTEKKPNEGSGINRWLKNKVAAGPLVPGQGAGQPLEVDLDLLDDNPKQPRQQMDAEALSELQASIRLYGIIQPITVTKQPDGRYIVLAGHRRTQAMRELRNSAATEEERRQWSKIAATDRGPTANEQFAELALTENLLRDDLRPIETAEALSSLKDARSFSTEQLAAHLGLESTKTKRLLQLAGAPDSIKQALGKGLMVELPPEQPDGKGRREHRQLELSHALQVLRVHGHWHRSKPKKAVELTRALIEKVLLEGWPLRKLKQHVDGLIEGVAPSATDSETSKEEAAPVSRRVILFTDDPIKLVVHKAKLTDASFEDRTHLKKVLTELLAEL